MARPRQKQKRDRQFNVGLTARELALLQAGAARAAMRPVDYGRAQLLGAPRELGGYPGSSPHLDPLLLAHLSRLGNNLNQIARRLNTLDQPAPPALEPLLFDIRALINKATASDT